MHEFSGFDFQAGQVFLDLFSVLVEQANVPQIFVRLILVWLPFVFTLNLHKVIRTVLVMAGDLAILLRFLKVFAELVQRRYALAIDIPDVLQPIVEFKILIVNAVALLHLLAVAGQLQILEPALAVGQKWALIWLE